MNILIIDIDSKIVNLALKKVELYHLQHGDSVMWNMPLLESWADQIYVSCVFTQNKEECMEWEGLAGIGGSGYDLSITLPPEIEEVRPHINLGFTTRGCNRKCGFCIVPKKEGKFRIVGDILDLWDGKSRRIKLLDNNILLNVDHFRSVCQQARERYLYLDFNQGLDHRLLTKDIVKELRTILHKEYRFAFDKPQQFPSVRRALNLLQENGIKRSFWYVLVGFDTTFEEDICRLNFLRSKGQTAFVQRYTKTRGNRLLGQWANQHNMFKMVTFDEFLEIPKYAAFSAKYRADVQSYFDGGRKPSELVECSTNTIFK